MKVATMLPIAQIRWLVQVVPPHLPRHRHLLLQAVQPKLAAILLRIPVAPADIKFAAAAEYQGLMSQAVPIPITVALVSVILLNRPLFRQKGKKRVMVSIPSL